MDGRALGRQLKKEGRSQTWLAEQCGISQQHLSAVLAGTRPLTPDLHAAALKALGVTSPRSFELYKGRIVAVPAVVRKAHPLVREHTQDILDEAWKVSWIEEHGAVVLAEAAERALQLHHNIAAAEADLASRAR